MKGQAVKSVCKGVSILLVRWAFDFFSNLEFPRQERLRRNQSRNGIELGGIESYTTCQSNNLMAEVLDIQATDHFQQIRLLLLFLKENLSHAR